MSVKSTAITGIICGLALSAIGATSASAYQVATIGNVTVFDYGRVDSATAPDPSQAAPASIIGTSVTANKGQPGGANPYAPNAGWDPYGLSDTTHHWTDIGDSNTGAIYNYSGSLLSMIWGSPNDDSEGHQNTVTFYSGDNGTGSIVGSVSAFDLYNYFTGIDNTQDPGYKISFVTSEAFGSVKFDTGPSAFEYAVTTGVPEASTWTMMAAGFAGVAFLGFRRKRQPIALAL